MELALSGTELDPEEPITLLVDAARRNGLRWIELWYPKNLERLGRKQSLRAVADAGMRIVCVSSGTEMARHDGVQQHQKQLIAAIQLADEVGAPFANTYFGSLKICSDHSAIDLYCANIAPCLECAEKLGVTIVLENEFDAFGWDPAGSDVTRRPDSLLRLVQRINSKFFRLTFDPCNAYFAGLEPFPSTYALLQPYISLIHFKDGHRLTQPDSAPDGWKAFKDSGYNYATCDGGEGALNWPGLLKRLALDGYQGFISVEPHSEKHKRAEAWDHAVRVLRNWLLHSGTSGRENE